MKVVGIVKVDFPDKNDSSKRVQGVSVHYLKPITFDGGSGYTTDKIFLSNWYIENRLNGEIPETYPEGPSGMPDKYDEIDFTYNKHGKIDNFYITKPTK